VSGVRPLRHDVHGDGATAVLVLHGFLGSGRNLGALVRGWSERAPGLRLVTADLTGHGRSPPLPPDPTLDDLAADVAALAAKVGARAVVGHSLGGRAALRARQLAAGAIDRVVLLDISPAPLVGPSAPVGAVLAAVLEAPAGAPSREAMAAALRSEGLSETLVQWLLQSVERDAGGAVRWRIDRDALARLHVQSAGVDLWSSLAVGPTRCIRGGASPFVSDLDARRMIDAGCRVDTIAGVGHYVHVDGLASLLDLLAGSERWS